MSLSGYKPSTGTGKALIVLVDFSDSVATVPVSQMNNFFNQTGYSLNNNNGSVKDYWYDVSGHNWNFNFNVTTKYYRATYTKSTYDQQTNGEYSLFTEILGKMQAEGFDLTNFSYGTDGGFSYFCLIYTGDMGQNSLWSKMVKFSPAIALGNGKTISKFVVSNGGSTTSGSEPKIGTICHELGHLAFGWPDLYDQDGTGQGLGIYCLMASGNWGWGSSNTYETNPTPPCAYLRDCAGWETVKSCVAGTNSTDANTASSYRVDRSNTNEHFYIENRQNSGAAMR